jgi:hypothetical protein
VIYGFSPFYRAVGIVNAFPILVKCGLSRRWKTMGGGL